MKEIKVSHTFTARDGDTDAAEAAAQPALDAAPGHPDALHARALIEHRRGHGEQALRLLDLAIAGGVGDLAAALGNCGVVLASLGRHEDAIQRFERAIELAPGFVHAHVNLGSSLFHTRRIEAAMAAFERALAIDPNMPDAINCYGAALRATGRHTEARACFERAVALDPTNVNALNNLGLAFKDEGALGEALRCYDAVLARAPDFVDAHWNRGLALLTLGRLRRGWPGYAWRLKRAQLLQQGLVRQFVEPAWDGAPFHGKTLLVHAEQGFGDTLQFVRYLPAVKERGGDVILECQPELHRLLEGIAGADRVAAPGEGSRHFDLQVPLLSLPGIFETDLASLPASPIPYLSAPTSAARSWRARLRGPGLAVGLVWAGSPSHINDRNRSLALQALAPLDRVPCRYYSLQKGAAALGGERPAGPALVDLAPELGDFADTAGCLAALDLLVSVDTAPVHLAGALGRPVWNLLPSAPDWRWMLDRNDSPWYPSMRLFRQPRPGDWASVIGEVAAALAERARSPRADAG